MCSSLKLPRDEDPLSESEYVGRGGRGLVAGPGDSAPDCAGWSPCRCCCCFCSCNDEAITSAALSQQMGVPAATCPLSFAGLADMFKLVPAAVPSAPGCFSAYASCRSKGGGEDRHPHKRLNTEEEDPPGAMLGFTQMPGASLPLQGQGPGSWSSVYHLPIKFDLPNRNPIKGDTYEDGRISTSSPNQPMFISNRYGLVPRFPTLRIR
jgi:hypothetical protein